jgi:hypothetical protein
VRGDGGDNQLDEGNGDDAEPDLANMTKKDMQKHEKVERIVYTAL